MINAYQTSTGRVIADALPKEGETIQLKHWGACKVVRLFHTDRDNFITLECDTCNGLVGDCLPFPSMGKRVSWSEAFEVKE